MNDSTVPLAAIGLVGTILAFVVTPLFSLLKANNKALDNLVKSSENVANATTKGHEMTTKELRKGNDEAKKRNGHLAELVIQTGDNTVEALKSVKQQKVQEQKVEHQVIQQQE